MGRVSFYGNSVVSESLRGVLGASAATPTPVVDVAELSL
jgi:hypothetical protein